MATAGTDSFGGSWVREGAEPCLLCTSKIVELVLSAWLSGGGGGAGGGTGTNGVSSSHQSSGVSSCCINGWHLACCVLTIAPETSLLHGYEQTPVCLLKRSGPQVPGWGQAEGILDLDLGVEHDGYLQVPEDLSLQARGILHVQGNS